MHVEILCASLALISVSVTGRLGGSGGQFPSSCEIPQKHTAAQERLLAGLISLVQGYNGLNVLLTKYCAKV